MINIIHSTRYGIYIIQNTIYRYPDKMPQCKWCTKDEAKVLQGRDKCYRGVTWYNKDIKKVLKRCGMV